MEITNENYLEILDMVMDDIDYEPNKVLPDLEALFAFDKKNIIVLEALTHVHYRLKNYTEAFNYASQALDIDLEDEMALK